MRLFDSGQPAAPPLPAIETFRIDPPPVARDSFSHPLFGELAEGLLAQPPADRKTAFAGLAGKLEPRARAAALAGAVRHFANGGYRALLAPLLQSMTGFAQLAEVEPFILLLDPGQPVEARQPGLAGSQLQCVLRDEPRRAKEFRRLAAHIAKVPPSSG